MPTHARRSQRLILFLFLRIKSKSHHTAGFELTDQHHIKSSIRGLPLGHRGDRMHYNNAGSMSAWPHTLLFYYEFMWEQICIISYMVPASRYTQLPGTYVITSKLSFFASGARCWRLLPPKSVPVIVHAGAKKSTGQLPCCHQLCCVMYRLSNTYRCFLSILSSKKCRVCRQIFNVRPWCCRKFPSWLLKNVPCFVHAVANQISAG